MLFHLFHRSTISIAQKSRTTPLDVIRFPSVVVCNINSHQKSMIYKFTRGREYETDFISPLIEKEYITGHEFNYTDEEKEAIERILREDDYIRGL